MRTLKECIDCQFLGKCSETSPDKVLAHYTCPRWESDLSEIVAARLDALRQFGPTILDPLVHPPKEG